MIYLGLPQWQHPAWSGIGIRNLADYSRHFNCVEGNTTFYALPKSEIVYRWRDMTTAQFRFCFKFPSTISHQAALTQCDDLLTEFYHCLQPINDRIGQLWLQLPAAFAPEHLFRLWNFLDGLPQAFNYGVEVRHPEFFNKGEAERLLNQGLHQRNINRVLLDSRPVHHAHPLSVAVRDAQRKKPKLPAHAVCTADKPLIRFIGGDQLADNRRWLIPWIEKLKQWDVSSHTPYLFIHTPDCSDAPQQARELWLDLAQHLSGLPPQPDWPRQDSLF